jgi:DNA-binding CsgD family transcriptional regulator
MWDFISAIGEEKDLHGFITRTLSELSLLFPYDSSFAAIGDVSPTDGSERISLFTNGIPDTAVRAYLDYYYRIDAVRWSLTPDTRTFAVDWKSRKFARNEFAQDYMRGMLQARSDAGVSAISPGGIGGMAIGFARSGFGAISRRDRAILDVMCPHIRNYYAMHTKLAALSADGFRAAELARGCQPLSKREAEVASLLCKRLTASDIAAALLISPRTVERHVEHIYCKLAVQNRQELLRLLLGTAPAPGTAAAAARVTS